MEVGEFVKEQILLSVAESSSPISGGAFKKSLSAAYKKQKEADGLPGVANLELTGEMLDSLDYKTTKDGIEIGVFGRAALRADGHNNFSGESELPGRQFLPKEGESFKPSIQKEIDRIIRDKLTENLSISRRDFATVRNGIELWQVLREFFPGYRKSQIVETVLRNRQFVGLLDEFNLLRFLDGEE